MKPPTPKTIPTPAPIQATVLNVVVNFLSNIIFQTIAIVKFDQNGELIWKTGFDNTYADYVGNVSGSATSTGSFGTLETSGVINASGRIFEQGTSVIDHATAMSIVFGG